MSRTLKISVTFNVVLAAACSFLLVWNLQQSSLTTKRDIAPATNPFDWKQLDAADFPTFVRNLRAAGCPEATIRDIITGEVTEIYREKERALPSASSPAASAGKTSADSAGSLARIHAERDRTIATLLAPSSSSADSARTFTATNPAADAALSSANGNANAAAAGDGLALQNENAASPFDTSNAAPPVSLTRPVYPAIYAHNASVAAIDAGLARPSTRSAAAQATSATERAVADAITQKFVEAVGPTPQDPNDLGYRQRWDAAVRMSDKMYADHFGARALQKRQIEAAVQLAQQQAGAAK